MGTSSLSDIKDTVLQQTPWFSGFYNCSASVSSLVLFSEALLQGLCCRLNHLFSTFRPAVTFCNGHCLIQKEASLMRGERSMWI